MKGLAMFGGVRMNVAVALACIATTWACGAATVVYKTDFDSAAGCAGWKRNSVWKVEEGAGVGGSSAMVWTNGDPANYDVSSFTIPGVKAGQSLRAKVKVKPYELDGTGVDCTICWVDDDLRYIRGAGGPVVKWGDKDLKPDADGWYELEVKTTPHLPLAMNRAYFQIYITKGGIGRVAFDDVTIELVDEKTVSGSVKRAVTSRYRNIASDGDVRVVACADLPAQYRAPGKIRATLDYTGQDGKKKTAEMRLRDNRFVETVLPVGNIAMGKQEMTVSAAGADGCSFGSCKVAFERVKRIPDLRVRLDRHGRTLIDGKPFFPIGMYWSVGTLQKIPGSLEKYASGPFNCLQNYDMQLTPENLDAYWEKGLRVIVGFPHAFAPIWPNIVDPKIKRRYSRPELEGVILKDWKDEEEFLTRRVKELRSHPALLGWHICDELPFRFYDRLKVHYEIFRDLDPHHPVFININNTGMARMYIDCADTIGFDSYCIPQPTKSRLLPVAKPDFGEAWISTEIVEQTIKESAGVLPVWQVPQAFAWKWDKPKEPYMRFPTFRELKAQTWQQIAVGANGLIFYSYSQILKCRDTPEEKETYFRTVCDVSREVRDMIPVLTLEPGPAVKVLPARTRVRTWRDGETVYALACNTHPEPRKGEVRIPGVWKFCETVFGSGISLEDGALELDMEPFGVTIVKLRGDSAVSGAESGVNGPRISVFANFIRKIAKERGVALAEAAKMLHAIGVRGFDVGPFDKDLPELASSKLKPINFYYFARMFDPVNGVKGAKECIDQAVKYSVPRIMLVPSNFTGKADREEEFSHMLEWTKKFVADAKARGIVVTVEDYGGTGNPCSYSKYLERFLDEIPDIGFAYDTGNLHYAGRGEDILRFLEIAKDRIEHVHLKDLTAEDNRKYASLGLGAVPNEKSVRALASAGYSGWYTLEDPVGDTYIDTVRQVAVLKAWLADPDLSRR